jgi:hypothetical protein
MQVSPIPRTMPVALSLALAAAGPVAIGAILALRFHTASPLAMVPAITFGVVGVTSPALYIATALSGDAPTLAQMARALQLSLGAFGIALAGLILPAAFLSLSSIENITTVGVATVALAGAAVLALVRLAVELGREKPTTSLLRVFVFGAWTIATIGIAARLWWSFAMTEVVS